MAETTYYPNSTDCVAYDGFNSGERPTAVIDTIAYVLSEGETDTISTDDDNADSYTTIDGAYAGHRVHFKLTEDEDTISQLNIITKGWGVFNLFGVPQNYGYFLYIWSFDLGSYGLLDSHAVGTKHALEVPVTEDIPDYIDGSGYLHLLMMSPTVMGNTSGTANIIYTYYVELGLAYTPSAGRRRICRRPSGHIFEQSSECPGVRLGNSIRYKRGKRWL